MKLHARPALSTAALLLCILAAGAFLCGCASVPDTAAPQGSSPDEAAASPEPAEYSWQPLSSIDDLRGLWKSSDGGTWEYPVEDGSAVYVRRSFPAQDDTARWKDYAVRSGMDMQTLWEKRYACMPLIYGQELPAADANGTQYGRKVTKNRSGRITSTRVYLIPEKTAALNLAAFRRSEDGTVLCETQDFHLFSAKFRNLQPTGALYRQQDAP